MWWFHDELRGAARRSSAAHNCRRRQTMEASATDAVHARTHPDLDIDVGCVVPIFCLFDMRVGWVETRQKWDAGEGEEEEEQVESC